MASMTAPSTPHQEQAHAVWGARHRSAIRLARPADERRAGPAAALR